MRARSASNTSNNNNTNHNISFSLDPNSILVPLYALSRSYPALGQVYTSFETLVQTHRTHPQTYRKLYDTAADIVKCLAKRKTLMEGQVLLDLTQNLSKTLEHLAIFMNERAQRHYFTKLIHHASDKKKESAWSETLEDLRVQVRFFVKVRSLSVITQEKAKQRHRSSTMITPNNNNNNNDEMIKISSTSLPTQSELLIISEKEENMNVSLMVKRKRKMSWIQPQHQTNKSFSVATWVNQINEEIEEEEEEEQIRERTAAAVIRAY